MAKSTHGILCLRKTPLGIHLFGERPSIVNAKQKLR